MRAGHPLVLMAASAVCFALMAFFVKLAAAGLPGSEIAFLRFACMLVPLAIVPRWRRRAFVWGRRDLLLYRGLFGGLAVLLYFLAIAHVPVGIATLLNYTSPVWSVLFAAWFLEERIDRRLLAPLVAALGGMALAVLGQGAAGLSMPSLWDLAGIGSAVLAGAALAAIRAARRSEGSWAIYLSFAVCGLGATAPFALTGFVAPSPTEWLLVAGVGGTALVAQLLMTYAYRWVTNLEAGVLSQLTVVLSLVLGASFLGDRLTPTQIVGCALAIGGVVGVVALQSTPRSTG